MSSHLDPDESRRVEAPPGTCPKWKLAAMVLPTDKFSLLLAGQSNPQTVLFLDMDGLVNLLCNPF